MESLSTFIQSPLFSPLFICFIVLVAIVLFWWRAGSIHAVLDRFWRVVAGKADVNDPVLKSLLLESRDIEKFQFIYRLKIETIADIHKISTWRSKHGIGMFQLQKIRRWVDIKSTEIVCEPPKHYAISHFIFGCLAMLLIIAISQLDASHDAYLRMRTSNVWFKTDATNVKALFGEWSFNLKRCESNKAELLELTGFNASEIDVVCNAYKDDHLKHFVKETVELQVWAGCVFILFTVIFAFVNVLAAASAQEALRLRKKLNSAASTANSSNETERIETNIC